MQISTSSLCHFQQTTQFEMVIPSLFLAKATGLFHRGSPYLPPKFPAHHATGVDCYKAVSLTSGTICKRKMKYSFGEFFGTEVVMSAARNNHQLTVDDNLPQEPFWLSLIKEALWGLKALCVFLVEQPSQLKYIEWPSFNSTLKTATLTLVLVALLIVALSSVDSGSRSEDYHRGSVPKIVTLQSSQGDDCIALVLIFAAAMVCRILHRISLVAAGFQSRTISCLFFFVIQPPLKWS